MKLFTFLIITFFHSFVTLAEYPLKDSNKLRKDKKSNVNFTTKSNCLPSNARLFMEFNNVRCIIEVSRSMWQNRLMATTAYEVPKGSGNHVIFVAI